MKKINIEDAANRHINKLLYDEINNNDVSEFENGRSKALTTYGTAIFKAGADFVMHSLSRMRWYAAIKVIEEYNNKK